MVFARFSGDVGVIEQVGTPEFFGPHPDSDSVRPSNLWFEAFPGIFPDPERVPLQRRAVQGKVDLHGFAQFSRTTGRTRIRAGESGNGFQCPDQDCGREIFFFCYHIQHEMHSISEIDIRMSRRSVHDSGPGSTTMKGMTCGVVLTDIRFCFYDPADPSFAPLFAHQIFTDKIAGYFQCATGVE